MTDTMDQRPGAPPCARCGQHHVRDGKPTCPGHKTNCDGTLNACRNFRVHGAPVCFSHGARAPQVKAAAARRVEAEKLERAVVTYGAKREIGHLQALVELLHDSAGHVAWLRDQVQLQAPEALVWGVADEINRRSGEFPGVDRKSAAAPSVWLELYHRERRLLLDLSKELARLELDWDAREAIRRQGAALARVVRETVRLLGHDPSDERVVRAFLAALRSANAGPGAENMIEGSGV